MKNIVVFLVLSVSVWATGLVTVESKYSVSDSVEKLNKIINAKPGFRVFTIVDHQAGAQSVGLSMLPETLIIFGNPKGGTKLMQLDPQMAYELPMKILVREDKNGKVYAQYRDVNWLAEHYKIAQSPVLKKMRKLLEGLTYALTK